MYGSSVERQKREGLFVYIQSNRNKDLRINKPQHKDNLHRNEPQQKEALRKNKPKQKELLDNKSYFSTKEDEN